jgi:hypothetical protein
MMTKKAPILAAAVAAFMGLPAQSPAQEALEARCDHPAVHTADARDGCIAAAQAIVSVQPAVGILVAGGSPTIGTAGATGFRLGFIPRVSAGLRLNVVPIRLPDLLADQIGGPTGGLARRYGAPAPAFAGDVAVSVTPGFSLAPAFGGIGAVSLLGSASYLPFDLFTDGFRRSDLAYGLGARVNLLSESFVAPGVAVSLMRRAVGEVNFGNICPDGVVPLPMVDGVEPGVCPGGGNIGEFSFDLVNWSSRLVASKHFLGIGGAVGLGYDRYRSDFDLGFRSDQQSPSPEGVFVFRTTEDDLRSSRWTVFGNLSYTLIVATLSLEAGWQQGTAPLTGFRNLQANFDPRGGSWYAGLGGRVSL